MCLQIFIAWAVASAFIVAPGYLLARGASCAKPLALGVAPFVSVACSAGLAVLYGLVGIPSSWATLFLPPLAIGALWALWRIQFGREHALRLSPALSSPILKKRAPWLTYERLALMLALGSGVATSFFVYVCSIDNPTSFIQNYDNAFHLSRIRDFLTTRNYSSVRSSFYPSAWHGLAAMTVDALGIDIATSEIVATLAFISVAYPLGAFLMLAAIFPENPRCVLLGSVVCLTIAFFPWRLILFGPLFPNVASLCLVPGVVGVFILLCSDGPSGRQRAVLGSLFVAGGIALALAQPNGIFSAAVILAPFCLWRVRTLVTGLLEGHTKSHKTGLGFVAELATLAVIAIVWYATYKAPFMQGVVHYTHDPILSAGQAVNWGLCFSFTIKRQQYFLGAIAILGLALSLLRGRTRWVFGSFAFALAIYVACASLPADNTLKTLLSGFWYNDVYRVGATECIAAIPLIAIGFNGIFDFFQLVFRFIARHAESGANSLARIANSLALATVAAVLTLNAFAWDFIEQYWKSYGFDAVEYELRAAYNEESYHFLGTDELAFLSKVKDEVGDSLLINQPYDGSVFAYSIFQLNVETRAFGAEGQAADILIASSLDELATNTEVQAAVNEIGAKYVLQLDQGDDPESGMNPNGSIYAFTNSNDYWGGINRVNDNTPGFELVLSEGDMRLYRIVS